jgi:predicted dehydrogenase
MGKLHLLNSMRIKGVKVVAAADRSRRNLSFARGFRLKAYDDYIKLIDGENLDAVIISLPNFLKKDSVFCASEKDFAIFLDKPLSRNSTEAVEIVRKVEKRNVRLMVGVNYRYFDCMQSVAEALEDGAVGDIIIATSDLIMNGPFTHPLVPTPVSDWWLNKEMAGGGALFDLGYHLVDIFNWMFGDLRVEYSNLGYRFNLPVEDSATVVLESRKTSTKCVANAGWFSKMIFPNFNFRVNIHGTVGYDSTDRYSPGNLRTHAIKQGLGNILRKLFARKVNFLSYTYYYSSFYKTLEMFFNKVREGEELPVQLRSQLEVTRVIEDIYRHHGVK